MITSDLFDKKQLRLFKNSKQRMINFFTNRQVVLFYRRASEDAEISGFSFAKVFGIKINLPQ